LLLVDEGQWCISNAADGIIAESVDDRSAIDAPRASRVADDGRSGEPHGYIRATIRRDTQIVVGNIAAVQRDTNTRVPCIRLCEDGRKAIIREHALADRYFHNPRAGIAVYMKAINIVDHFHVAQGSRDSP